MATEVVIPEVGEVGMDVTFVRWLKAEGDEVHAGEPLFEVDTAKAVMEVEAFVDGRLTSLQVKDGDMVTPHQVVAVILAPGEEPPAAGQEADRELAAPPSTAERTAGEPAPVEPAAAAPPAGAGTRPGASPRARRLAREKGVDLSVVTGSGPGGLITELDVERAASAASGHGMREILVQSSRPVEAIDVTELVLNQVLPDGFAWCATQHTTAALLICEGDPDMLLDIEKAAAGLFASFEPFRHRRNDKPNAAAHLVSSIFGTSLVVPVVGGRIQLGPWQRIVFLELDGPRQRRIHIAAMGAGMAERQGPGG
jgi:secondary thiamine-phosphate synthase enzyme